MFLAFLPGKQIAIKKNYIFFDGEVMEKRKETFICEDGIPNLRALFEPFDCLKYLNGLYDCLPNRESPPL